MYHQQKRLNHNWNGFKMAQSYDEDPSEEIIIERVDSDDEQEQSELQARKKSRSLENSDQVIETPQKVAADLVKVIIVRPSTYQSRLEDRFLSCNGCFSPSLFYF